MILKTLDRYILKEILSPFIFGLGAFTILFFSVETLVGVARMISEAGLAWSVVLEYLGCRLPQVLIFTFPMATLMSCLLAFGRLSGESELTALRASGLSFFRIAFPVLIFFFCLSSFSFWLNDAVVPAKMKRAFEILVSSQKKDLVTKAMLTTPKVMGNGFEQIVYAHTFDLEKRSMEGVYIHYFMHNRRRREIYADQARWTGKVWELQGMRSREYGQNQDLIYEVDADQGWTGLQPGESPPSPEDLKNRKLRPEEMTRKELKSTLEKLEQEQQKGISNKRDQYAVLYHQKASLPWVSFIFATFAIPLGVRPHRASKSMGLGLSLVFILIFYVLMAIGLVLGESGTIDPMLGAWLPNIIFGVMGLFLLIGATRS